MTKNESDKILEQLTSDALTIVTKKEMLAEIEGLIERGDFDFDSGVLKIYKIGKRYGYYYTC